MLQKFEGNFKNLEAARRLAMIAERERMEQMRIMAGNETHYQKPSTSQPSRFKPTQNPIAH